MGSYGRAYFRCHLLHIACDELLEIGINSFFGIGNYDVIQNHVVAFLVDTSDHSSTNQLSLKFVKNVSKKVKQQLQRNMPQQKIKQDKNSYT